MRDDAHAPEVGDSENDVAADEEESDKVDEDVEEPEGNGQAKIVPFKYFKSVRRPLLCSQPQAANDDQSDYFNALDGNGRFGVRVIEQAWAGRRRAVAVACHGEKMIQIVFVEIVKLQAKIVAPRLRIYRVERMAICSGGHQFQKTM